MTTFDSKFLRVHSVVADKYGIDPLLDKTVPLIQAISRFTYHAVVQSEKGAPDLIAYNEYGTEALYWVITAYNGICLFSDIIEGIKIKIPDYTAVITVLNGSTIQTERPRVITI